MEPGILPIARFRSALLVLAVLLSFGAGTQAWAQPPGEPEGSVYSRPGPYVGFTGLLPIVAFYGNNGDSAVLTMGGAFVAGERRSSWLAFEAIGEVAAGVYPDNNVSWFATAGPKLYLQSDRVQPYVFFGIGPGMADTDSAPWFTFRWAIGVESYITESVALVGEAAMTLQALNSESAYIQIGPRIGVLYRF